MAIQQPRKISLNDLNPNIGVGVALPFNAPGVFKITYTTKEQVRSNLINFILTNRKERVMNPSFGADIRSLLFSQIDDIDTMKSVLQDKISFYFGNIIISEVNIEPDTDRNLIRIHIIYSLKNNPNDLDSVQINLG